MATQIELIYTDGQILEHLDEKYRPLHLLHKTMTAAGIELTESGLRDRLNRMVKDDAVQRNHKGANPSYRLPQAELPQGTKASDELRPKRTFDPPKRDRRIPMETPTNGTGALKIGDLQPISTPMRGEWPEWVCHIVDQKQAIIDEQYRRIDTMNEFFEQAQDEAQAAIVPIQQSVSVRPTMSVQDLLERDRFIRDMIDNFLKPGIDYGPPFPGSKEIALRKSGAEKFMAVFELRPDYVEIEKVVSRDPTPGGFVAGHIRYEYRCNLHLQHLGGPIVGTAIGICSTEEEKYKYRKLERTCPECGEATVYRSKHADQKTGQKGWFCWKKKDGCGANFDADDERITSQEVGRVENVDLLGLQHTIAAMAQKRAFVLALRTTTGLSAYFSEAVADDNGEGQRTTIQGTATQKTSASIASELIDYAESLLPEGHGFTRSQIGAACLAALNMKDWSDDYDGSLDDAKQAIARSINKKVGNGEKAESGEDAPPDATESPETLSQVHWASNEIDLRQFIADYREFCISVDGLKPTVQAARNRLIAAMKLNGEAKNFAEFQALILAQYSGDIGDAIQAYTIYEW